MGTYCSIGNSHLGWHQFSSILDLCVNHWAKQRPRRCTNAILGYCRANIHRHECYRRLC